MVTMTDIKTEHLVIQLTSLTVHCLANAILWLY